MVSHGTDPGEVSKDILYDVWLHVSPCVGKTLASTNVPCENVTRNSCHSQVIEVRIQGADT